VKALRFLAALILIIGASSLARPIHARKAQFAQRPHRLGWEQSLQSGKPHGPWGWADTYPIARLTSRTGYDELVLEGAIAPAL